MSFSQISIYKKNLTELSDEQKYRIKKIIFSSFDIVAIFSWLPN